MWKVLRKTPSCEVRQIFELLSEIFLLSKVYYIYYIYILVFLCAFSPLVVAVCMERHMLLALNWFLLLLLVECKNKRNVGGAFRHISSSRVQKYVTIKLQSRPTLCTESKKERERETRFSAVSRLLNLTVKRVDKCAISKIRSVTALGQQTPLPFHSPSTSPPLAESVTDTSVHPQLVRCLLYIHLSWNQR